MIKILLLSGFEINSTYANSLCAVKIMEEMKKHHNVIIDIACNGVVEETPVGNWKSNPIYMFRRILRWPSNNPNVEAKCRKELFDILDNSEYDCLLVPHKPFETVYAACKAKKRFPNIKLYVYALDPIANEIDANNGIGKHLFCLTKHAEKRVFKIADHIFQMECNRTKYFDKKYQKYWKKFSYVDFPLIESGESHAGKKTEEIERSIKMIYSGILDDTYRSPDYFLTLFELICEEISIQVDFYTKGNSVSRIIRKSEKNEAISVHGYIPKVEIEREINEADFLLNIGNKYSSMLPSKLLTYFSTGKPIVHIQSQKQDAAIQYLEKYELSLILNENDSLEANAEKLITFIESNYGRRLSSEYVESVFVKNTPSWSSEHILEQICRDCC